MAYSGKYKPQNPSKVIGDPNNIVYRSDWERRLASYLDSHPLVMNWASEEVVIPYKSPVDKRTHRYFVDFFARFRRPNGEVVDYLIEVKPHIQRHPPKPEMQAKHPRRYKKALLTYAVNKAKWEAAEAVCRAKGWKFVIMDEYDLGIVKRRA